MKSVSENANYSRSVMLATVLVIITVSPMAMADDDSRKKNARAMWVEAVGLYDLGRFDDAIALFERAYSIDHDPDILYNLAQAHRQKKNYERALFYYKAYLRNQATTTLRFSVEERIDELEKRVKEQNEVSKKPSVDVARADTSPPHGAADVPTSDRDTQQKPRTWRWATLSLGVVAVAGGVTLIAIHEPAVTNNDRQEFSRSTRVPGIVLTFVGVLAAGISGYFLLMSKSDKQTSVRVAPTESGATLVVQGTF